MSALDCKKNFKAFLKANAICKFTIIHVKGHVQIFSPKFGDFFLSLRLEKCKKNL